ncbi:hypothetical protein [Streptomyces nitrosporeus]|uniref:hypothetical protein n=1 Tax=Streptomyces nitrosporeus TaxID=28894 RepID=UPI00142EEE99|nr:hypothetical protein [Streptomyces nitrosporeus]
MPEARTDTARTRSPEADAGRAGADSSGKHRGGASAEDTADRPHGRHRRPSDGSGGAAA